MDGVTVVMKNGDRYKRNVKPFLLLAGVAREIFKILGRNCFSN